MGVTVLPSALRHQMAVRGMSGRELAEVAGVSPASVSHAMAGRPISPATLQKICAALATRQVLEGAAALLGEG